MQSSTVWQTALWLAGCIPHLVCPLFTTCHPITHSAAPSLTPSTDVPANIAAEGSAPGGHLLARLAAPAAALQLQHAQQQVAQQAALAPCSLDALFVETGFQQASELAGAQASLLEQLNSTVRLPGRRGARPAPAGTPVPSTRPAGAAVLHACANFKLLIRP